MRRFFAYCGLLLAVFLFPASAGALPPDPEQAAEELARVIADKDIAVFQNLVDVPFLFAAPAILHYAETGKYASWVGYQDSLNADKLIEGIATGEFALEAADARTSGNPWYPPGLEKALVVKKSADSAIIAVDNEKGIRTWLIFYRTETGWRAGALANRIRLAESYASAGFLKAVQDYADAGTRIAAEEEKRERVYREKLEKAVSAAKVILDSVKITDLRFSVEKDDSSTQLVIKGAVLNGNSQVARLSQLCMRITDPQGKVVHSYTFNEHINIPPNGSAPLDIRTGLSSIESRERAEKLASGTYKATAAAICVYIDGNLVEEDGGSLKPSR